MSFADWLKLLETASLWITCFDNELLTSLLTTHCRQIFLLFSHFYGSCYLKFALPHGNSRRSSVSIGRARALEGEVNSLQTVITELEKTIAYQNKTAEDAKLQLEDEKWRLREHVQKLEDKVESILYRSLFLAFDQDLEASIKN